LTLSGGGFFALEHLQRLAGHDGGDRVLVHQLRMTIAAQQYAEIVKRRYDTRQLDAIDQEDCQGNFLFANGIKKKVLQILRTFRHGADSFLIADPIDRLTENLESPEA
jgi:hypothetical protein